MDKPDRDAIDDLFRKVAEAESQSGDRDAEAESYINSKLQQQPAAPYYLGQAVVMLEDALKHSNERIAQLEDELQRRPSGGFLSTIFGGGAPSTPSPAHQQHGRLNRADGSMAGTSSGQDGGRGFLGSAPGTGMAMVGGALLGYGMASSFGGDAEAADPKAGDAGEGTSDAGTDGGDLGGGDFDMDF